MTKKHHLLIISYYFPPVKVVGAIRLFHIYRESLKYFGSVEVLTTANRRLMEEDDSLHLEQVSITEAPAWDLRRLSLNRRKRSVAHLSRRAKSSHLCRFLRRLIDSFPFNILLGDGGLVYILMGYFKTKRLVEQEGITHLFSSFRPYSDHIIAYLLKRRYPRLYWIADFRDLHVDPLLKNTFFPAFQRWCNRQILRRANLVTTVSEGLKAHLQELAPEVYVLRNGITLPEQKEDPLTLYKKFTIAYTGALYEGKRDPRPLFRAIRSLFSLGKIDAKELALLYAGPEGALWEELATEYQLEGITESRGLLSRKEALEIQKRSHANLLLSWSSPEVQGMLTSKVFEYLQSGRPIIALVNGPRDKELEQLLTGFGQAAFYSLDPDCEEKMAHHLSQLQARDPNMNEKSQFERLRPFSWAHQMECFSRAIFV